MDDKRKAALRDQKRAKWLLGGTGVAVAAALLSQIQYAESKNDVMPPLRDEWISHAEYLELDRDQQTLLTLDWSPFVDETVAITPVERQTRSS